MPGSSNSVVHRAKANRADMTNAERRLWSLLRDRRLSYKFRRQHPIGKYIVDFACPGIHLVIEVDGSNHDSPEQSAFDAEREAYLVDRGWRVLRIPNSHVFLSIGEVEAVIRNILEPRR
jgi:very-short-patch-repair endonuclease